MRTKRLGVIAAAVAVAAGGTGVAIAATSNGPRDEEQAVIDDAAKRLDVTPGKLRSALTEAQDAQLDQAVKDGGLTQKQADAIKARRKAEGHVLGGVGGGELRPGGPAGKGFGRHRFGGPGGPMGGPGGAFGLFRGAVGDELSKALGVSQAELRRQLRAGKSIADVAKAQGKSLDGVKATLKAAAKTRLDKAVADKDLTQAQADAIARHVDEALTRLGDAMPEWRGHRRDHDGPGRPGRPGGLGGPGFGPPPPPDMRPGAEPAPPAVPGRPS